MTIDVETQLKTLRLTKTAFEKVKPTSKHKLETLSYAFEQVKPILKDFMKENNILTIELNLETKRLLALEPISNQERQIWVNEWLENRISTKQLRKKLKLRYHWVEYVSFSDFLAGVEFWLKEKAEKMCETWLS